MTYAVRGLVSGQVQGVGFRNHVRQAVQSTKLVGHALNLADRTVEVLLIGDQNEVIEVQKATQEGPRYARVDRVDWEIVEAVSTEGFRVG